MRSFAKYQPPHAAPATAATKSSVSRIGDTRRGFGCASVGRRAAVRTVAGMADVTGRIAVAEVRRCGSGGIRAVADCGFGTFDNVPGVDIADIVSRLKARSRADWKRSSRSFSRHRRVSRSSAGGMFGSESARSGGSSFRIALSVSIDELRLKARVPVSISYRIA